MGFLNMTAERETQADQNAEVAEQASPRKRKHSGFATRGEGIRVQGDLPFDPYRFQTFEITPAFRQRILEAPLPLLQPRDSFLELPPQSQQRAHSGANDVTLPELPESPSEPPQTVDRLLEPALDGPCAPDTARHSSRPSLMLANRRWLVAGALLMLILGFSCTYLAMRHSDPTPSSHNAQPSNGTSAGLPVQ